MANINECRFSITPQCTWVKSEGKVCLCGIDVVCRWDTLIGEASEFYDGDLTDLNEVIENLKVKAFDDMVARATKELEILKKFFQL